MTGRRRVEGRGVTQLQPPQAPPTPEFNSKAVTLPPATGSLPGLERAHRNACIGERNSRVALSHLWGRVFLLSNGSFFPVKHVNLFFI